MRHTNGNRMGKLLLYRHNLNDSAEGNTALQAGKERQEDKGKTTVFLLETVLATETNL